VVLGKCNIQPACGVDLLSQLRQTLARRSHRPVVILRCRNAAGWPTGTASGLQKVQFLEKFTFLDPA